MTNTLKKKTQQPTLELQNIEITHNPNTLVNLQNHSHLQSRRMFGKQ